MYWEFKLMLALSLIVLIFAMGVRKRTEIENQKVDAIIERSMSKLAVKVYGSNR